MSELQPGRKVFAKTKIEEYQNPSGTNQLYAETGDVGTILERCCEHWANVQFASSGAVTICHVSEISFDPFTDTRD